MEKIHIEGIWARYGATRAAIVRDDEGYHVVCDDTEDFSTWTKEEKSAEFVCWLEDAEISVPER